MTATATKGGLEAAIAVLSRIEALPLVRRRGQPENHKEPFYQGQTEEQWLRKGIFDDGGGLLRMAAAASVFVTRWQLRTSYYLARLNHDEEWARNIRDFDKTFGYKPRYQLIEVLEAIVHERMDLPTLPIYKYRQFLPEWREELFGELVLVHELRPRMYRILVQVRDGDRKSVEILVEDYGGSKLVEVQTSETGLGTTNFSNGYEHQHVSQIKKILDYLASKGVIREKVYEARILELLKYAKPDSPEWEQ